MIILNTMQVIITVGVLSFALGFLFMLCENKNQNPTAGRYVIVVFMMMVMASLIVGRFTLTVTPYTELLFVSFISVIVGSNVCYVPNNVIKKRVNKVALIYLVAFAFISIVVGNPYYYLKNSQEFGKLVNKVKASSQSKTEKPIEIIIEKTEKDEAREVFVLLKKMKEIGVLFLGNTVGNLDNNTIEKWIHSFRMSELIKYDNIYKMIDVDAKTKETMSRIYLNQDASNRNGFFIGHIFSPKTKTVFDILISDEEFTCDRLEFYFVPDARQRSITSVKQHLIHDFTDGVIWIKVR